MKYILTTLLLFTVMVVNSQVVIPFTLKEDNRIYIEGIINKSDTLDLLFDLGANITVVNKTRMEAKNVNIEFDTIVSNNGGNGTSNEEKSFSNQITVGGKKYQGIEILGISYPEIDILDGLIGWNFFKEKIVKINYESKELLVYDNLPELSKGYSKCKFKIINETPHIEITVFKGKKKVKLWAMLDTGYNATLKIYYNTVTKKSLSNEYQVIGESTSYGTDGNVSKADMVLVPKFDLGGFEIYNMPVNLVKTKVDSPTTALLGGNLLKRFHIVLDFEKKFVYLKPNLNINSKF